MARLPHNACIAFLFPFFGTADVGNRVAKEGTEKFSDFVQNDIGKFDFGDFQMLVVTLIALGTFVVMIFHCLEKVEFVKTATLPDLDLTLPASFGLGQGAYLTKKSAGDVGKS